MILAGGATLIVGIVLATVDAAGTDAQAGDLAQQVLLACAAGGPASRQLDDLGACPQAVAVAADTDTSAVLDAGLDTEQVVALVRAELDRRPTASGPTAVEVQDAVREVAGARPDLFRSPTASDAEVRAAAIAVIAADPSAFRGDRGDRGVPGQDGEDGERGEPGERGSTGPPGRGIVRSEQDPDDPCTRTLFYDQPPLVEQWRTCADPVLPSQPAPSPAPAAPAQEAVEPAPSTAPIDDAPGGTLG